MGVRRRSPVVAVVAAMAVLVSACGSAGGGQAGSDVAVGEPQRGGTVVFSNNSDAQSLDAARCGQNANWGSCHAVYGTLLNYDVDAQEFSPGMAESFTSDDGMVWTLTLREGVRFSDGTQFDAEAVVFNWDRTKDPANLSPAASVAKAMSYQVVDPRTVRVTLPSVNWQLPWAMNSELAFIGSPAAIRAKGPDFANAPVGAGPFRLESWTRGTRMSFVRNDTYWDQPRPYLDRLEFAPIPPDVQRGNALRSGDSDLIATLVQREAEQIASEGYADAPLHHVGGVGLRFSHRNGAMADPDVRLAIAKLIDSQQVNNAAVEGIPAATTFAAPGNPLYDPEAVFPAQDLPGAQALIDGYRARTGGGEVVVSMRFIGGQPRGERYAQTIQAQLQRAAGLRVQLVGVDAAAYATDLSKGNYDLFLYGINGVNPDTLYLQFHTGETQNTGGYSDPATDAALERGRATRDPALQLAAYKEATRHIAANLGMYSWHYQTTHLIARDDVHGVRPAYAYAFRTDLVWKEQG